MYDFNRISDNSYLKIKNLSKESFGINREISSIEKKYDTSLFGKKNLGVMAETEDGEPAAFYGVFPIRISYKKEDLLVAQSGDTMTSPNHRKKGLFTKLAKLTYELAEKEGVKAVYGFPNENSLPGFKHKLNWIFNDAMQRFMISGSSFPLCEFSYKYPAFRSIYYKYSRFRIGKYSLELTEDNIKGFNENLSGGFVTKDLNYFKYKLRGKGTHLIEVNGFKLLIKAEAHLQIGVAAYFEESRQNDFINTIKSIGKKMGCRKVILIMSKNHWLYDYLKKNETAEESLPIGFYIIDETFDPSIVEFTQSDYDTF